VNVEGLSRPRRLERSDIRTTFRSGVPELDTWLHRYAYQNQSPDSAAAYVSCISSHVVGFYTIAAGAISRSRGTGSITDGQVSEDYPCILLARLAVDQRYVARGIGSALLEDALRRALHVSASLGATAVLVHAADAASRSFYQHQVDCFPSPVDDLQLVIPMSFIAQVYGSAPVHVAS